jgi:proline dehydrogenase
MSLLYQFAKRFVAGETLEEMLPKVQALAAEGFAITADLLGESVDTREATETAAREYLLLLQALTDAGLEPHISIKLSQLGLTFDRDLARAHLLRIVSEAHRLNGYVCVDMEGSDHTGATLALVAEVHRQVPCIGTVLQSMLRRTPQDLDALLAEGIPLRLVKGAYKEPAAVAYQRTSEICEQFQVLAIRLLERGRKPAIGTHDEELIRAVQHAMDQLDMAKEAFEFQFLYGIRRDLQEELLADGWRVRLYVPYGNAWAPYFYRRLRERKENVWFVMKNLFRP